MSRFVSKIRTTVKYASTGIRLGGDFRSKWLLASMLGRSKLRYFREFSRSNTFGAAIRFGELQSVLHFRADDIFIVHEVFAGDGYVVDALRDDPPRSIVDLGAHIGLATLRFKASFPEATVHCFEPDPDNFKLLTLNTQNLNGVVCHQEAVGATSGEAVFYLCPHRHTAGSLKKQGNELVIDVPCLVRSLDDILSIIGAVDLIKFDIEGAEYEVFAHSKLAHEVEHIVGEMKGGPEELRRFCALFLDHVARWRSITPRMHLIYLQHKASY